MTIRKLFAFTALVLAVITSASADSGSRYWVYFRDKGLSGADVPQALQQAEQSLTSRARARREKNHAALADANDIPVANRYVEQVRANGVRIRTVNPWLNAISIEANAEQVAAIQRLSFVQSVERFRTRKADMNLRAQPQQGSLDLNYGPSFHQYELCHIPQVQARGLSGQGVLICFLDTGYELTHEAFDSMHVLAKYDFIHGDTVVHDVAGEDSSGQSQHGTATLSTCGGYKDSVLVGPAYHATYLLAKTEWGPTETPPEEDFYAAAIHWADSIGADVTSSSLGYIDWYTWPDMNGHTAVTTRALEVAASHGILCVTAEGNERNSAWGHLVAPADAESILAVGAVDTNGVLAGFSSPGPTFDGRIKPDVAAQGEWVYCAEGYHPDNYFYLAGTSLATPIVAGVAALVMEAHPTWPAQTVREAIKNTASNANTPNNDIGWGVVNALAAVDYVPNAAPPTPAPIPRTTMLLSEYPNPVNGVATITLSLPSDGTGRLVMYDLQGREAYTWQQTKWTAGEQRVTLNTEGFTTGIYFVRFTGSAGHAVQKMVILK